MTIRTDIHRVSEIVPADYWYCFSYALPSSVGGWPVPALNTDLVVKLRHKGAKFAEHGCLGKCTVCGTPHIYGDVWKHVKTEEHIFVGHICADKYGLIAQRQDFERELGAVRDRSVKEHEAAMAQERFDEFVEQYDGLKKDLTEDHYIIRDIAAKLLKWGSISEKQVALVRKLADEVRNPKPEEKMVPAPIEPKRQTVKGTIVSVKGYENDYGFQLKMTVKCQTEDGAWLAWGTLPSSLSDEQDARQRAVEDVYYKGCQELVDENPKAELPDYPEVTLKGAEVKFDARLKQGRDEYFALISRPTKAQVLSWANDS